MKQFNVTGMSCAACSSHIEKEVSSLVGVESCSVNLLTNSMSVSGTASDAEIIDAVKKAGYGASLKGESKTQSDDISDSMKKEFKSVKNRLLASLGFLALLMYFSMGHTMLKLPLPPFLDGNFIAIGIIQMLLCICIMILNKKFFINGVKSILNLSLNMDTLVSLGSLASFGYSLVYLFLMTARPESAGEYLHEFYFESAAMILVLITLGKLLETRAKGKTTDALRSLMKLAPKTVTVIRDGTETVLPTEELKCGDIFIVRPGESIPADGVVIEGRSAVDESALTGESIPVEKETESKVSAASVNLSGILKCRAEKVGEDTTFSQIIKMVSDASATKAPIAKIADRVSGIFVPAVILIAIITFTVWMLIGQTAGFAIARAVSVLVISCPCALGLATPVAIMVSSGIGAKNGILFKTAESIEKLGKTEIVALDKTGTVTSGKPKVTDILTADGVSEAELLEIAYALEYNSEHPLAKAVVSYGKEKNLPLRKTEDFEALTGSGLTAKADGAVICGGNLAFISSIAQIDDKMLERAREFADEGKTPLFFCKESTLLGIICVADTLKDDSVKAVGEMRNMGIYLAMITGDNARTASAISKEVGVDEVISDMLPDGKTKEIQRLKKDGLVAMVGDGINDAPALANADVGVAIGAGTDVAIDAAEVVLVNSKLTDVSCAIRLGRATLRTIYQNLFWAFCYNIVGIPLAAGVFIPLMDWQLNPMFGAAAMSVSSLFVVSNALRLNLVNFKNSKNDKTRKRKNKKHKEKTGMQKTIKIEGMMCAHCEARVKKILEGLDNVESADVSHVSGTAKVNLKEDVADAQFKEKIEAEGYKVISIE